MAVRRVIVVGAGPAGLATAIALQRCGIAVTVHERAPDLSTAGTGLTLWPNGLRALDSFGAGDAVRAVSLAAPGMSMKSRTGRVLSEVSGASLDLIGGRGVAAHRADLLAALAGLLDAETLRFGVGCTAVRSDADRSVATFDDGGELAADLIVGADGIRSKIRSASRISAPLTYGGFTVWRAVIPFALPGFPGLMTLGGSSQFGMWQLPGDRIYWFASTPAAEGEQPPGASRPPELFSTWHEPIPALLAATPTEHIVVTDIYDSAPLSAWSAGRVVLVGDAAHPSMPNMGQGTSQAFEDAAVLACCVASGAGIGAALAEYESRRRHRARAAWSQARQLARLGGLDNAVLCWLRDRLMSAAPARAQLRQLERLFAFDGQS